MKEKGFTLIELLAVIVILAIIALIATPMIMDVIEKSRKGAAIESVNGILDAAEKYQLNQMMDGESIQKEIDLRSDILSYKGSKPENGKLIINDDNQMHIIARYGNYCIEKKFEEDSPKVVESERCNGQIEEDYKEPLLNGADPVLKGNLIPVVIESNGTVKKANIKQEWYWYENKEWANAVILKDESIIYENNEIIPEENIESYFVWIPKYSYQLWDMGEYSGLTSVDNSKVHSIAIKFGLENTIDTKEGECTTPGVSGESGNCQVGDYMTHPAFLSFHTNGIWVGKFETGYEGVTKESQENQANASKVIIKPNVYSWFNLTIGNAFQTSYEYQRELESHMMKNTEWGAVAYLSHSIYGINGKIRLNNNSNIITGYSATEEPTVYYPNSGSVEGNRYEGTEPGIDGSYTVNYRNPLSEVSSTTGNKTGIYDMSGGGAERVMGYTIGVDTLDDTNGITDQYPAFFTDGSWNKYYDRYSPTEYNNYQNRILGDATGEMGPFQLYREGNWSTNIMSWYGTYSYPNQKPNLWFLRSGSYETGKLIGIWVFSISGGKATGNAFRIVLAP